MAPTSLTTLNQPAPRARPFRRAVLRGLGVLLPPLLTIVIFVWIGNTVAVYLLEPLESWARAIIYNNRYASEILPPSAAEGATEADRKLLAEGTFTQGGRE